MKQLPHIKEKTLYVDDKPFMLLAGELHNSASGDINFMKHAIWPNLEGLNLNTILFPVTWELVEPSEGQFDFTLLNEILEQCREHNMRAVVLWFGLWKNAESHYVPGWVKRDTKRFPRAEKYNGDKLDCVSPLSQEAVQKDAEAFAQLMAFLRDNDGDEQTVLMVQVENEIGLLGTDRDYSEAAESLFVASIPEEVSKEWDAKGSWEDVFGTNAAEYFMAYHFAKAVELIASAGKKEYGLPLFANAWLEQWPWQPGDYPSGGPQAKMHKMWKAIAPTLDFLAPDIYAPNLVEVCEEYCGDNNTLFVPEARADAAYVTHAPYTLLGMDAIGWSPFGIEGMRMMEVFPELPPEVMMYMEALSIDVSAFDTTGSFKYYPAAYAFLKNIAPLYYEKRHSADWQCFIRKSEYHKGDILTLQKSRLKITYRPSEKGKPTSGGGIVELGPDKFLIYGYRCKLEMMALPGSHDKIGITTFRNAYIHEGVIIPGQIFNGDERMNFALGDELTCLLIETYSY